MFQFIKKLFFFLIPIGLVFIIPTSIFFFGREYYPVEKVVEVQQANPDVLYGLAYNNVSEAYKKALIEKINPKVIAVGSSRVMQFRKEFFAEPATFVNAGGGISTLGQMEKFLRELPADSNVKFMIFGVEQDAFKSASSAHTYMSGQKEDITSEWLRNDWRLAYMDYFNGKISLKALFNTYKETHDIGLSALLKKNGFRGDGSYKYGEISSDLFHTETLAKENALFLGSIKNDRSTFQYGKSISEEALSSVDTILKLAKEKGIYVVGFSPPYPYEFYKEIISMEDEYKKTALEFPKKMQVIFSANGFKYYDFSNVQVLKAKDSEFVNSGHGSDKMHVRMALYMLERDGELNKYFDAKKLKEMLQNTKGDFLAI
jgi:hypothetical protein